MKDQRLKRLLILYDFATNCRLTQQEYDHAKSVMAARQISPRNAVANALGLTFADIEALKKAKDGRPFCRLSDADLHRGIFQSPAATTVLATPSKETSPLRSNPIYILSNGVPHDQNNSSSSTNIFGGVHSNAAISPDERVTPILLKPLSPVLIIREPFLQVVSVSPLVDPAEFTRRREVIDSELRRIRLVGHTADDLKRLEAAVLELEQCAGIINESPPAPTAKLHPPEPVRP